MSSYGNFRAILEADVKANRNFQDAKNINIKGILSLNDFHLGENQYDDYASFDKLAVNIEVLNPKDHKYIFDSLSLIHTFFMYERYDYTDNIQTMFGEKVSRISMAKANPKNFRLKQIHSLLLRIL